MRKLTILSALFAGTLALGCGSSRSGGPAQPNNVTGRAATTTTGIDSTGNPAPGTATGVNPGLAPNPSEQPGIESGDSMDQPVAPNPGASDGQGTTSPSGTDASGDVNGNPDQTGSSPTDTTTTKPDRSGSSTGTTSTPDNSGTTTSPSGGSANPK